MHILDSDDKVTLLSWGEEPMNLPVTMLVCCSVLWSLLVSDHTPSWDQKQPHNLPDAWQIGKRRQAGEQAEKDMVVKIKVKTWNRNHRKLLPGSPPHKVHWEKMLIWKLFFTVNIYRLQIQIVGSKAWILMVIPLNFVMFGNLLNFSVLYIFICEVGMIMVPT